MPWKIILLILGGVVFVLGVVKVLWEQRRRKRGRRTKRDIIITLVLSLALVVIPQIISMLNILKPSQTDESLKRIEGKLDKAIEEREGLSYYEDGIPQSDNLNLRKLFEEGKRRLNNYEFDKAIKAFRAGLVLQGIRPLEGAALLLHIGICQHGQLQWDEAEGSFKEALDWLRKGGDKGDGTAAVLTRLGLLYENQGAFHKALTSHQSSLSLKQAINDSLGMAVTLNNLGIVYRSMDSLDRAIEVHDSSITICRQIGDKRIMAKNLNNLGNIYLDKADYENAERVYLKSLTIKEEEGVGAEMASTLGNLALVHQARGDYGKALEFYSRTLKIDEKGHDKRQIARTKGNMAILYKMQGETEKAKKIFEELLTFFEEIGDSSGAHIARWHLEDLKKERQEARSPDETDYESK